MSVHSYPQPAAPSSHLATPTQTVSSMLGEIPGMNGSSTEVEKGEKLEGDNVVFRGDDTSEEVEFDEGHLHRCVAR